MTVRDLLRHTSGLTYGFFGPGLVKQAYKASGLESARGIDSAQFAERIARLPLAYEPGTRLFERLGMKGTSFTVPEPERQARIAEPSPKQRVPHRAALRELVYGAATDVKVAAGR